ncbi:MAG: restriction endonuclease subunit S [Candidatus Peribacteria bacterium]|nr:restriction endonuclease subunit S [Candidatus Peribacteria bacterium]
MPKGSICVSCIATVGLVSITSQNSQTNQQINSIIPSNEIHTEYLYYHMQSMKDKFIAI